MTNDKPRPSNRKGHKPDRKTRLAGELRANLIKRKAAEQERAERSTAANNNKENDEEPMR